MLAAKERHVDRLESDSEPGTQRSTWRCEIMKWLWLTPVRELFGPRRAAPPYPFRLLAPTQDPSVFELSASFDFNLGALIAADV